MTNNIQKALEDVLNYANELQQNHLKNRLKLSKKQVDYNTLLEKVSSMIEDLKDYTVVDAELLCNFEQAKKDKDVNLLEDVKSDCEYYLEACWQGVQPITSTIGFPNALGGY